MRENTLIFPLCRDTLGCGRTEISCSTGSVKNGLHGCNGKGEGFPRFSESRGAVLIWHSLRGPGEGTCLGKGQQSEVCSILARLRILERPNLWVAGTKAEQLCVCHGESAGVKAQLCSPGAGQRAGPTNTLWHDLELSLQLSFSQSNSSATQGFHFSQQSNPALTQSHPEDFPASPDPGKQQTGCRLDVVALSEVSPIPAALFCPPLPSLPPASVFSGFHSRHSSKSKMGLN